MKKIIITLLLFLGIATHSHAGFYVIPVVTEKEVIKEVCTGVSVGDRVFELTNVPEYGKYTWGLIGLGGVYQTSTGKLIQITGTYDDYTSVKYLLSEDTFFYVAPPNLPNPTYGVKGPFYYIAEGQIAYAKYL